MLILVSGTPHEIEMIERERETLAVKTGLDLLVRRTKSPEDHRRASGVPCLVTAAALVVREG